MCAPSRRARPPAGADRGRREPPEHTACDAADAQARHIPELVGLVSEDRARCAQPAADRRSDTLAEIARGEPGRIAGDEGVVAAHDLDLAAEVIAEAARVVVRARSE